MLTFSTFRAVHFDLFHSATLPSAGLTEESLLGCGSRRIRRQLSFLCLQLPARPNHVSGALRSISPHSPRLAARLLLISLNYCYVVVYFLTIFDKFHTSSSFQLLRAWNKPHDNPEECVVITAGRTCEAHENGMKPDGLVRTRCHSLRFLRSCWHKLLPEILPT